VSGRDFVSVVSGVPRSGTSLVMQMLAAGGLPVRADGERPADEHNPRGYLEYEPVKRLRRDAGFVAGCVGHAVKVVLPLTCELPAGFAYRILLVRREPGQVLASQERMLAGQPEVEAAALPGARLMEIFRAQEAELEAWAEARPEVRLLRLEHAEVLTAPERAAEAIADFLGPGLDVAAMAGAADRSLHRQRGPR